MNNLKPKKVDVDGFKSILKKSIKIYKKNFFQALSFGLWLLLITAIFKQVPVYGNKISIFISVLMTIGYTNACNKFYTGGADSFTDFFSFFHNKETAFKTFQLVLFYIGVTLILMFLSESIAKTELNAITISLLILMQLGSALIGLLLWFSTPILLFQNKSFIELPGILKKIIILNWLYFFVFFLIKMFLITFFTILLGHLSNLILPGFLGILIFGFYLEAFQDKPFIE